MKRQWPQKYGIEYTEDSSVSSNPESEGQDNNRGEQRLLGECAKGVAYILHSYSVRRAMIGSTLEARRAGSQAARKATNEIKTTIALKVTGSHALTPNSRLLNKRVAAKAPTSPIATLMPTIIIACPITNLKMLYFAAPSAIRMPISLVRWATE